MTVYSNNIFPNSAPTNSNMIIFENKFSKDFNFNHPIQNIEILFPFYFYNDKDKNNFVFLDSNQKNLSFKYSVIKSNGKELPGIFQYYNDYHPLFFYSLSSRNIENLSINISKNLDDELSGIYIDEKYNSYCRSYWILSCR